MSVEDTNMEGNPAFLRAILLALGAAGCAGPATSSGPSTSSNPPPIAPTSATTADPHTPTAEAPCAGAVALLDNQGDWSGLSQCPDGAIVRVQPVVCSATAEFPSCEVTGTYASCASDADCTDAPEGHCVGTQGSGFYDEGCGCAYGCATDADCATGSVCVCGGALPHGNPWSTCVPSGCATGDDCASGTCGIAQAADDPCGSYTISGACHTDADTCHTDADCDGFTSSGTDTGYGYTFGAWCDAPSWTCQAEGYICGRPLRIEGTERVAGVAPRHDWTAPGVARAARADLAAHWLSIAAMEHASIASFARVSLQLAVLGAPPEILRGTHLAAADEVEHARLAFGLARSYGAAEAGPRGLRLDGFSLDAARAQVLADLVAEGCVAETVAAAELQEAASGAVDPELRAVLTRIAADEMRHAALAWRTLRWLLDTGSPSERVAVAATFEQEIARVSAAKAPSLHAPEHGVLGGACLLRSRLRTVDAVIRPAMAAVLAA
jgi:hypothetical protein